MAKKILLADDSITIQKVISLTLASEDYDLIIVGDGEAAVQKAEETRPDLVIADVTMPGKTGYEVSSFIKNHPSLKGTPVLLLAGTFETVDTKQMAAAGADDHIIKPFESEDLIKKIRALLSRPAEAAPSEERLPEEEVLAEIEFEKPEEPAAAAPPEPAAVAAMPPMPPEPAPVAAAPPGAPQKPKPPITEDVWEAGDFLGGSEEETVEAPKEEGVSDEGFDFFGLEEEKPTEKPQAKEKALKAEAFIDTGFTEEAAKPSPPPKPAEAPVKPQPEVNAPETPSFELTEPEEALVTAPVETMFELGEPDKLKRTEAEPFIAPPPQAQKITPPPAPPKAEAGAKTEELPGAEALGALSKERIEEIITKVARQVVEEIAWEVVPELAEELIRREIMDKLRAAMTKGK